MARLDLNLQPSVFGLKSPFQALDVMYGCRISDGQHIANFGGSFVRHRIAVPNTRGNRQQPHGGKGNAEET